jgi:hypothetical protein
MKMVLPTAPWLRRHGDQHAQGLNDPSSTAATLKQTEFLLLATPDFQGSIKPIPRLEDLAPCADPRRELPTA